jgi:hypothetical protein
MALPHRSIDTRNLCNHAGLRDRSFSDTVLRNSGKCLHRKVRSLSAPPLFPAPANRADNQSVRLVRISAAARILETFSGHVSHAETLIAAFIFQLVSQYFVVGVFVEPAERHVSATAKIIDTRSPFLG